MKESEYIRQNFKVLGLLKQIRIFENFNDDDLKSFLTYGRFRDYEPGEIIIKEGEFDSWVYFLIDGVVEIVKDGKRISILQRIGDLFGEMGLVDGSPRSATIKALARTVVLGVDGSILDTMDVQSSLAFRYTIFRIFSEVLAVRLRITTEDNIHLKEILGQKDNLIKQALNIKAKKQTDDKI